MLLEKQFGIYDNFSQYCITDLFTIYVILYYTLLSV